MPVNKNWEEALKVFMADTGSLADRNSVAGPGSARWTTTDGVRVLKDINPNQDWSKTFDVFWTGVATLQDANGQNVASPVHFVAGFNIDKKNVFDSPTSKWNLWFSDPKKNLAPLVGSPFKNEVVNPLSFEHAAAQVTSIVGWFDEWLPTIKKWGDAVDSGTDEWKGSAAGAFKKFLNVIHVEMSKVRLDITAPSDYAALITTAKDQLKASATGMNTAFDEWYVTRNANGLNVLHDAFWKVMSKAELQVTWKAYSYGDTYGYEPDVWKIVDNDKSDISQAYWLDGVESAAKALWIANLEKLDTAAKNHLGLLDTAYSKLAGALKEGVYQPNISMPGGGTGPTPPPNPQNNPLNPGGKNPLDGKGGAGGPGGPKKPPELKPGGGAGPGNKPPSGLPGSLKPGSGSGTGAGVPLLDKNGKPVLGPDGKPVLVPPGSRIGKDGKVYDPKGNPVLGPGGKPVIAPPGAKVGQLPPGGPPQGPLQPGSSPYDQIRLPEGAKVLENGTVVDANGKPLLDSNGNPYTLPKGATVKDGIVVGADGKPISRTHQLLTNAEHALNSRPVPKPNTQSGGLPSFEFKSGGTSGGGRFPGLDGLGSGGGSGSGLVNGAQPKGIAGTVGGMTGIGEWGTQRGASVAGNPAAAAANAAAQQQRDALQGQAPPQSPMMPPMSPGAGGAGGQPNQGKDRQRTTWLTEDEEVWGTDTGSVSGVIGR
ncbi:MULTISPECIES: hypothetical protein [unclassified Streptomyces]|uniref:hypothetical protein n=1 Tax=unclassified Streptomyces TaxID=2593676 RepID=UPI002251EA32|nr:hypothetical protein [Streptomyces sp. NBC_00047]MCX5613207.1 hypothetical protein [Streptomyces sp. NBC_00047]